MLFAFSVRLFAPPVTHTMARHARTLYNHVSILFYTKSNVILMFDGVWHVLCSWCCMYRCCIWFIIIIWFRCWCWCCCLVSFNINLFPIIIRIWNMEQVTSNMYMHIDMSTSMNRQTWRWQMTAIWTWRFARYSSTCAFHYSLSSLISSLLIAFHSLTHLVFSLQTIQLDHFQFLIPIIFYLIHMVVLVVIQVHLLLMLLSK